VYCGKKHCNLIGCNVRIVIIKAQKAKNWIQMLLTSDGASLEVHEEGKFFADPLKKCVHQLSTDREKIQLNL